MRKGIFSLIILVISLHVSFAEGSLIVHPSSKGYTVLDKYSNKTIYSDEEAGEAIQFAIENTERGEVVLSRGCYHINRPIYIKSEVRLVGQGRGTELRLAGGNKIVVVFQDVNQSALSYLAINAGNSLQTNSTGILVINSAEILVEEVLVVGFKDYGIDVYSCAGFNIEGSYIIGNNLSNIRFADLTSGQNGNAVTNCIFLWGRAGLICENSNDLTIHSCVVQQTNGIPLDLNGNDITVTKCRTFYSESLDADVILKGADIQVSNNIFCWGRGNGILVDEAKQVIITENNIIDHGTPPGNNIFKSGVLLINGSEKVEIVGNSIWNWDDMTQGPMLYGIEERPGCKNNYFAYNTIQFYKEKAVLAKGKGTLVENNSFDPGNDDLKELPDFDVWRVYINDFINEELLNTEVTNWSGNDFIVSLDGENIIVKSGLSQDTVFAANDATTAIQWAIDKSALYGGSIEIAAGSYTINRTIVVKKNIWLKGQGKATVLNAASSMGPCIRMEDAPQSRVSDMKLVQAGNVFTGIEIYKSITGKVTNVVIDGFRKYGVDFVIDYNLPEITWGNKAISSLVEVRNCLIANSGEVNINIPHHGGYIGNAVPNLISKNTIIGGGIGIDCKGICTNLIDNIIVNTKGTGIVMDANSILTSGNILYRCGGSAIVAFDGKQSFHFHPTYDRQDNNNNKECNITQNWIIDTKGHGIEVSEQWGTVSDNLIINSGINSGQRYGIWLHEDSETYCIYNNMIFNTNSNYLMPYGIRENGFNNLVAKNVISGVRIDGVRSNGIKTIVQDNKATIINTSHKGEEWNFDKAVTSDMEREAVLEYITNKIKIYKQRFNTCSKNKFIY